MIPRVNKYAGLPKAKLYWYNTYLLNLLFEYINTQHTVYHIKTILLE